jgi:hypothetical protein
LLPISLTWSTGSKAAVNKPSLMGIRFFSLEFVCGIRRTLLLVRIFFLKQQAFSDLPGGCFPGKNDSIDMENAASEWVDLLKEDPREGGFLFFILFPNRRGDRLFL